MKRKAWRVEEVPRPNVPALCVVRSSLTELAAVSTQGVCSRNATMPAATHARA